MSTPDPITVPEMAAMLQQVVNNDLADICDPADGDSFEMTAPATGQRFRVTVAEIPRWSDRMDAELAQALTEEAAT